MRAALPKLIPMSASITNCSQGASLVIYLPAFSFSEFKPVHNEVVNLFSELELTFMMKGPLEYSQADETYIQVAGILLGDSKQLGQALNSDVIVEPVRGPLIPGFSSVKEAALAAGNWLIPSMSFP